MLVRKLIYFLYNGMRRLYGFADWLIESMIQKEATLRFGTKFRDQDANRVPPGFWNWVIDRMQENPSWTPAVEDDHGRLMSRDQVLALARLRSANKTSPTEQPVVKSLSKDPWVLAKVVNVAGLQPGDPVVLTKGANGDWILMTRTGVTKNIPAPEVRSAVVSVRDEQGNAVTSSDPEHLWEKVPPTAKPEEAPSPSGVNPHILDPKRLSEEQREIDQDFEKMMISPKQNHMMISALAGTGKAQPLNSLLLTPNGWTRMGDIKVGDKIFGSDGKAHNVTGVFPQGVKKVVEVKFTDGSKVECCEDHLWFTETKKNRDKSRFCKKPLFSNGSVISTKEMIVTLKYKGSPNHYIPLVKPLEFGKKVIPIDPYLMGVLLGDRDREIVDSVKYDYTIVGSGKGCPSPLVEDIESFNIWKRYSNEKFIPNEYKFNSINVRLGVLQGLLDTDGNVDPKTSNIKYNSTSKQLADDVKFLVESLGGVVALTNRVTKYTYKGKKKKGNLSYRLSIKFPAEFEPFRLSRKKNDYVPRTKYFPRRSIESIEYVGDKECQCISVDSPDNLYVTECCILTHNTTILKHLAWKYGKPGQKWLYLVFNAKNRAEAKESSGGFRKFPDWVEIYTTNSFLGHVMGNKANYGVLPQTDRITSIETEDSSGKKVEKARIMVDSPTFGRLMTQTYHLPEWDQVKDKVPDILKDFGVTDDRGRRRGRDKSFFEVCMDTIERTIDSIRYNFKERVLTLLGLLKSFSVDPRRKDKLHEEVRRVFDKYDVAHYPGGEIETGYFDTELEDIKERISKYKPNFRDIVLNVLQEILHYDFMKKSYKEEVIDATTWMLEKTMPQGTDETYTSKRKGAKKEMKYNLGDYRDFNDDIWFPTIHADQLHWPHYDVVLADEVQDFNEGQKIMLKKLAEMGAKIVAVGDSNQSIYRFRGADSDAFDNLAEMLKGLSNDKENWKPKSLSLNFRSRPEVLQYVNSHTHVKNLKPGKKFKDGDLPAEVTHGKIKYDESFDMIAKERAKGSLVETAYIARTNEPLVHAALKLLGKGIPFAIIGKDVSGDLMKHIVKIIRKEGMEDKTPILRFQDALMKHEEEEVNKNSKYSTKKEYLAGLKDATLALKASIEQFTNNGEDRDKTLGQFKTWLQAKLGGNSFDFDQSDETKSEADLKAYREKLEKEKPIVLTTSHKSKGLEFPRVFILRNDQFPHPRAKHPEELGQEANTQYVAYTRAMNQLHNLDPEGQPGYKDK